MLAEQFLAHRYQRYRADHEITSSGIFCPSRPTIIASTRDRVKQDTNSKEQLNCQE